MFAGKQRDQQAPAGGGSEDGEFHLGWLLSRRCQLNFRGGRLHTGQWTGIEGRLNLECCGNSVGWDSHGDLAELASVKTAAANPDLLIRDRIPKSHGGRRFSR